MSFEYLILGAAILAAVGFAIIVGLVMLVFFIRRVSGGKPIVGSSDPLADAAAKMVSVADSGRLRGAMKVIDSMAEYEGQMFADNVAKGVAPKAAAPSGK